MYVDRPFQIEIVNKKVIPKDMGFLDIGFDGRDIDNLANPAVGYITDRFMGCTETGSVTGWMPEDKIHIRIETPRHLDQEDKFVELTLDPGGDLYFSIWDTPVLQRSKRESEFTVEAPFLVADPSNKLGHAGITAIRLHQLVDVADALESQRIHNWSPEWYSR